MKISRILTLYLIRETISFFLISLFAFIGILFTLNVLKLASLIINKGVGITKIGLVFLSLFPTFFEIAIPLSALLGVMLAFARLSGDSELVVLRGSGISLLQLTVPVLLFGAVVSVGSFFVSRELKPWGYTTLAQTLFEIAREKSTAGLSQGVFNKIGDLTLYADAIDDRNGNLIRVVVDDRREKNLRRTIFAQTGRLLSDPDARSLTVHLQEGTIHEILNGKYVTTQFEKNIIRLDTDDTMGDSLQKGRSPRELTQEELEEAQKIFHEYAKILHDGGEIHPEEILLGKQLLGDQEPKPSVVQRKLTRLGLEEGMRISMPFASFILALVALPLGVHPPRMQRTWGAGLSAVAGIFVFVTYYAVLSVGITLSEAGSVPPLLAVWLPNFLAFTVGLYLLYKVATERWQSIADGVDQFTQFLRRLLLFKKAA